MKFMDKIKVGIIGLGFIAERHAYAYSLLPDVEIVAVSSLLEDEAKELMKKYKIPGEPIKDYMELLEKDLDLVSICVPNFLHKQIGIDALRWDKHVVIEKPLARNVSEAVELVTEAEKNRKHIFYAENNIYSPSFRKLKAVLDEGATGKIYMARGKEQYSGPHSEWYYKMGSAGGGALIDLGSPDIATLVWLLGSDVNKVFCQTTVTQPDRGKFGESEVEDNVVGILYFENGAQVVIEESWTAPGDHTMKFEIYGADGQIVADPYRMTPLSVYSKKGYGYAAENISSTSGWTFPIPEEAWNLGFTQEIKYFVECVQKGRRSLTDGKFGLKILNIIETMYKSAKSGKIEDVIH